MENTILIIIALVVMVFIVRKLGKTVRESCCGCVRSMAAGKCQCSCVQVLEGKETCGCGGGNTDKPGGDIQLARPDFASIGQGDKAVSASRR